MILVLVGKNVEERARAIYIHRNLIDKGYNFMCTTHDITAEVHTFQGVRLAGLSVLTYKWSYLC